MKGGIWMYRKGESRLFDSPESVPSGEGWVDSPALVEATVEEPKKKRGRPPKVAEEPVEDEPEPDDNDNA